MTMSDDEIRRAAVALDTIDRFGHEDELCQRIREATADLPGCGIWGNATIGALAAGGIMATRLSKLLGVSKRRAQRAVAEALSPQRSMAILEVLLGYEREIKQAAGLIGPRRK